MEDTRMCRDDAADVSDEMDIGYLVKVLSDRFRARSDKEMKERNLTMSQIQTMIFIHQHDGAVSQKEIERFLKVSHPTVVGIVSRMEKNGYVSTHQDEKDHRNKIVCTTPLADATRDEAIASRQQMNDTVRTGLTDEEVTELKRLLLTVYRNLD